MIIPSIVPATIDKLVALSLATLGPLGVNVSDSDPIAMDVGDWLCIGVEDPEGPTPHHTADSSQEWSGATRALGLDETAFITCSAIAWSGDDDVKTVRDRVYAILAGLTALIREDPRLGIPGVVRIVVASTDLTQGVAAEGGTFARLVFRLAVKARL